MAGRTAHPWFRDSKNTWYATIDGKKISLKVKGKGNEAEAWKAYHNLLDNGSQEAKPKALTVAEVITAFLADAERRVKPITFAFYRRFLDPFAKSHGKGKIVALTLTQAEQWARKPTWSNSTRHDALGTLATAFRWAERNRLIERSPLIGLRLPPKESKGAEAVVSEDDFARMIAHTEGDFQSLLRFLWLTGCRPSEATQLTADAVDWQSSCIVLRKHKTAHKGKSRVIYLSADALALLNAQKEKHGTGFLFLGETGKPWGRKVLAQKMWRLQKRLGIKATAYGLRHTFATDALANGVPDAHVAELLGHSGTAMIHKHYAHLTSKAKALRNALDKIR